MAPAPTPIPIVARNSVVVILVPIVKHVIGKMN